MTNPDEALLHLRLFGQIEVTVQGGPIAAARTRKAFWLLALLALHEGREVDRKWLAGTFWQDSTDELALYNLRRYLVVLRDLLGPEHDRICAPSPRSVALDVEGAFVDVLEFDRCIASDRIDEAIALYRGPLLEGCLEEWALPERETREVAFLAALEKAADAALQSGDAEKSETLYRRALRVDPLRESAVRGLLSALQSSGQIANAVQAYREFRYLLRSELNAEPSEETAALFQSVRQSSSHSPTVDLRLAAPVPVRAGKLPAPLTPILGRKAEIDAVRRSLMAHRAVTLTGTGGVGKTRLALAIAEEMRPELPQGAWFVDLSGLDDGSQVCSTIARELEVHPDSEQDAWGTLLRSLESSVMLLVLDNCEHVARECTEAIESLVAACPSVYVLSTSRHALEVPGGATVQVPPLPVPRQELTANGECGVERLTEVGSVQLFLDRARRASPSFELTGENAHAVAQVCAKTDGIPLAIELVAARVRGMTAQQIASRLDQIFDRPGLRSGPRHQASLRAAMEWSCGLLSDPERILLRRLSVFSGGCTLEAAEAICAGGEIEVPDVLGLLLQLIDKSLIQHEKADGYGRYRLLDTIRRYSEEMLATSEEAEVLRVRHADYFLAFAQEAHGHLAGPGEADWLSRLDREHDNLRVALQSPRDGAFHQRLAGALWRYWYYRGNFEEGQRWLEQAISMPDGTPSSRAAALHGAAVMSWKLAEYADAAERFEEALRLYRQLDNRPDLGLALNTQGLMEIELGDLAGARRGFEESLALFTETNAPPGMAFALENLGTVAIAEGDLDRAEELLNESMRLFHSAGCEQLVGTVLRHLAQIAVIRRKFDAARRLLEESVEIHERYGHRENLALAALRLAAVNTALNDLPAARRHLETGLAKVRGLGSRRGIATALTVFAHLASAEHDWRRAAQLFGANEALREELHFPLAPGWTEEHARRLNEARAALPAAEFEEALSEGRRLTVERAIQLAMESVQTDPAE